MIPLRDTQPSRGTPVVTYFLVGLNLAVFCLELTVPRELRPELFDLLGLVPLRYSRPEWARVMGFPVSDYWPWLTHMFLHGGWLHVLGNLWTLWIFGDNVEDRLGPLRYLVLYLLSGLAAAATHFVVHPDSTVPVVGASGAIAGVMGAYLVLFPRSWLIVLVPVLFIPFFFVVPAAFYLVFWFALQWASGLVTLLAPAAAVQPVAFWAHVGGFVAGIALLPLLLPRGPHWHPPEGYCWVSAKQV